MSVPVETINGGRAAQAVQRLPSTRAEVVALLDKWENSNVARVKAVVSQARKAQRASGRR
jgi:hypothetical protein